jgi:DNA end-binding protein Ku
MALQSADPTSTPALSHCGQRAYAVGKDHYVNVEDDELANIAIESTHTVDIEKFVLKASIDDRYRDRPYYLASEDKVGQEAFAHTKEELCRSNGSSA